MTQQRPSSYGQQRGFVGLEKFAIGKRLERAKKLVGQAQEKVQQPEVLELGCGYFGLNLVELSREFPSTRFTGVDLSVHSDPQGFSLIESDLSSWSPEKEYDCVLSLAVAEHLLDPAGHFGLIAKSLRSGGLAGITTPTPQADMVLSAFARLGIFDRDEIADHKLYLTETGLRKSVASAGLLLEEYTSFSLGFNQWLRVRKP